jgi:hypothetical protein
MPQAIVGYTYESLDPGGGHAVFIDAKRMLALRVSESAQYRMGESLQGLRPSRLSRGRV